MITVNYGAPTRMEQINYPNGGFLVHCVHDGPENHDQLQPGEQCECGVIGLGIVPDCEYVDDGRRNRFHIFEESFESLLPPEAQP